MINYYIGYELQGAYYVNKGNSTMISVCGICREQYFVTCYTIRHDKHGTFVRHFVTNTNTAKCFI